MEGTDTNDPTSHRLGDYPIVLHPGLLNNNLTNTPARCLFWAILNAKGVSKDERILGRFNIAKEVDIYDMLSFDYSYGELTG